MSSSARTWRGLRKAQWLSVPVGAVGYVAEKIPLIVGMPEQAVAGLVSGVTIVSNVVSVIDNLVLMCKYWDSLENAQIAKMTVGAFLSLALIAYAGVAFLDQSQIGVVALANLAVLGLNSFFRQPAIKIQKQDEVVFEGSKRRGTEVTVNDRRAF